MAIWAVVPVKPLRRGKSRLHAIMDRGSRLTLNHCLLQNTLETLSTVPEIEQVLVISRDPQVLSLARSFRARTIQETGSPHLNLALERATQYAKINSVHGVIIIPADLPLINSYDIQRLLVIKPSSASVVITPDRHRKGTNAMLISPPGAISYHYGDNSFQAHCEEALIAGIELKIFEVPSLALDLDTPEDLGIVRKQMRLLDFENLRKNQTSGKNGNGLHAESKINLEMENPCLQQFTTLFDGREIDPNYE